MQALQSRARGPVLEEVGDGVGGAKKGDKSVEGELKEAKELECWRQKWSWSAGGKSGVGVLEAKVLGES